MGGDVAALPDLVLVAGLLLAVAGIHEREELAHSTFCEPALINRVG